MNKSDSSPATPHEQQCGNCVHWARLHLQDGGRCYSTHQVSIHHPDAITLDSDGCKHWKPELEAA